MTERERRIRLAYLQGAEQWSRKTTGRGLTEGELEGHGSTCTMGATQEWRRVTAPVNQPIDPGALIRKINAGITYARCRFEHGFNAYGTCRTRHL